MTSARSAIHPGVLEDRHVRLEPLSLDHVADLWAAASGDRSTYDLAVVPGTAVDMRTYVEQALDEEKRLVSVPYAVRRKSDGKIVGSGRFMALEWFSWPVGRPVPAGEPRRKDAGDPPDAGEIGHLWYAKDAQRTAVNTATCRLLMVHGFDVWKMHRLFLKTDARNERSRTMILGLGATFEGVLRAHTPSADGRVRDTAMYSILPSEWPGVCARLDSRLAEREDRTP